MDASPRWTKFATHCPLSHEAILKIAAVLNIPAGKRETAALEIAEVFGLFNHPDSHDRDYWSPRRLEAESVCISEAAGNLVGVISNAHERTVMEFNIFSRRSLGRDYIEVAGFLETLALEIAQRWKRQSDEIYPEEPSKNHRGRPRSPNLGEEGVPAVERFIADMARIAKQHGGSFPGDKNNAARSSKKESKWERLRKLCEPGLPVGFFAGLLDNSRARIVQQINGKKRKNNQGKD
jgi:hypothetical protein